MYFWGFYRITNPRFLHKSYQYRVFDHISVAVCKLLYSLFPGGEDNEDYEQLGGLGNKYASAKAAAELQQSLEVAVDAKIAMSHVCLKFLDNRNKADAYLSN